MRDRKSRPKRTADSTAILALHPTSLRELYPLEWSQQVADAFILAVVLRRV